jgi:Leucine-rich repeat (LRR) protein
MLDLTECKSLTQLPPLAALTALQRLDLREFITLERLPLLATLTALQVLNLSGCIQLQQLPELDNLTRFRKLKLAKRSAERVAGSGVCHCIADIEAEKLSVNEAVATAGVSFSTKKLDLSCCQQLQQLPALDNPASLQTLVLNRCEQLQHLPSLDTLTSLKMLDISSCRQLRRLPPLNRLTALQERDVRSCQQLEDLPPLDRLTALRDLLLHGSEKLAKGCLKLPQSRRYLLTIGMDDDRLLFLEGEQVEEADCMKGQTSCSSFQSCCAASMHPKTGTCCMKLRYHGVFYSSVCGEVVSKLYSVISSPHSASVSKEHEHTESSCEIMLIAGIYCSSELA